MDKEKFRARILDSEGVCLFSNLKKEESSLFENCSSSNEIANVGKNKIRHGKITSDNGVVYVITDNQDILKSSSLFKNEQNIYSNLLPGIGTIRRKAFDDFKHDIPKIHGHNIQEIFSLIPQDEFQRVKTAQEQIGFIRSIIESNPDKAAQSLLKVIKNNSSMSNEFTILGSKYSNEYIVQLDSHKIHKIFRNVLVNFLADFDESNIVINLNPIEDSVVIDFSTFKGALIPFFDNAVKYAMPDSEINISFKSTTNYVITEIEMVSLEIKENEIELIVQEGVVGEMAKKSGKSGKGLGLFKIKNLFNISKTNMEIIPNAKISGRYFKNGLQYEANLFKFFIPRDTSI